VKNIVSYPNLLLIFLKNETAWDRNMMAGKGLLSGSYNRQAFSRTVSVTIGPNPERREIRSCKKNWEGIGAFAINPQRFAVG